MIEVHVHEHQEDKDEQREKRQSCWKMFKMENQGIEPVPPDQRPHTRIWDNFTIWFSVSTTLAYVLLGMLGWQLYRLAFWQAFVCIVIGNMICSLPGAFFSTLGFRTGLPQMVLVRYSFGYHGGKLVSVLAWINNAGWMIINIIQSTQFFAAMGDTGQPVLPMWAGVIILAALTWIICLVGYKLIHSLQRWLWIPMWTAFGLLYGLGLTRAGPISSVLSNPEAESTAVMSFFALIYSATALWPLAAGDFTVKQPTTFNTYAVGILSYLGGVIPTILIETLSFVLAATWMPQQHHNEAGNSGALAADVLAPLDWFGQILLVVFAFNVVGHVVPSAYNMALEIQTIVPWSTWLLATINMAIITILAVFGAENLVRILQIFLPLITYCIMGYITILVSEHFVFRSRKYNIESWNDPSQLPIGAAAIVTLIIAFGAGMLATDQPWYIGPIAKRIGDLGIPLSLAFGFSFYNPLRYWEKKSFHR